MRDQDAVAHELATWTQARLNEMSLNLGAAVRAASHQNSSGDLNREQATSLLSKTVVELVHLETCMKNLLVITAASQMLAERHGTDVRFAFRTLATASRISHRPLNDVAAQTLTYKQDASPGPQPDSQPDSRPAGQPEDDPVDRRPGVPHRALPAT